MTSKVPQQIENHIISNKARWQASMQASAYVAASESLQMSLMCWYATREALVVLIV